MTELTIEPGNSAVLIKRGGKMIAVVGDKAYWEKFDADDMALATLFHAAPDLLEALEPFARCMDFIETHARTLSDDTGLWTPGSSDPNAPSISVGDIRRARAAIEKTKP